jgi:hypothetical protein
MKTLATMIAACLALILHGAFVSAQATEISGHCTAMTVTDYVMSDHNDGTQSQAWVNITDGHLNLTTSATGCVIIMFSALAGVFPGSGNEQLHVRTLLDGNNLCAPPFSSDDLLDGVAPVPESATSVTRICRGVTAGAHTLQVQFRSDNGNEVTLSSHVLTITHS